MSRKNAALLIAAGAACAVLGGSLGAVLSSGDNSPPYPTTGIAEPVPSPETAPQPSRMKDEVQESSDKTGPEQAYLQTLYEFGVLNFTVGYLAEKYLGIGEHVCAAYDSGATSAQVNQVMVDAGLPGMEAAIVDGAAVGALCPEHTGK